jgi:ubiquinone/menaquinone biosynthesis C-methylase UbiE
MNVKPEIKQELTNLINNKKETEEIEVRFGNFKEKFTPQINAYSFEESNNFLRTFATLTKIEYSGIEYFENYKKYTLMKPANENETFSFEKTGETYCIEKKLLKNIDIQEYNLRISYNNEKKIEKIENEKKASFFLIRKRISYTFNNLRFDVSMYLKDNQEIKTSFNKPICFDLEIEIICKVEIESLFHEIWNILKIIQQTDYPLPNSTKYGVFNIYSSITKSKKFIGVQPETISSEKIIRNNEYAMTLKLDGKRALLMNIGNEFFEISSKMDIRFTQLVSKTNLKDITIIDTELFKGNYHVFDILFYEGNDIREQNFKIRTELLETFVSSIKSSNIISKKYVIGNTYLNSNIYYKEYFSKKNENVDGMIYVSTNAGYSVKPLKWKPYNTIDFKIRKIKNLTWELFCSGETLFSYPEYKTVGKTTVTEEQETFYPDGSIVEFFFSKETELFVPMKIRHDKLDGNYIAIARDNFKSAINTFEFEEFRHEKKKETVLFNGRRFNNYIKRKLLMDNTKNAYTLLDLCCGKGGDMHKWVDSNITVVKGYDNDMQSIRTANSRYNSSVREDPTAKNYRFSFEYADLSTEVVIPKLETEQTKFDIATCFFAIHYFFKEEKYLDTFIQNLTKNLKKNGLFIMTTFDDALLKLNNYSIDTELLKVSKKKEWKGDVFNRAIDVWIKDTVLNEPREEYVVPFDFLVSKMAENGFRLVKTGLHSEFYKEWKSGKNFLNDTEKMMCFLNRYSIFVYETISTVQLTPKVPIVKFQELNFEELVEPMPVIQIKQTQVLTKQDLQLKKIPELKEICKKLKLSQIGKKIELINNILETQK